MSNSLHPMFKRVCNTLDSFCLSQIISGHTHVSPGGNTSLIDLALTTSPSQIKHCFIIPPLANSDHNGLDLEIKWKASPSRTYSRRRTVWRYAHSEFSKACDLISETDWNAIICEDDIEKSWIQWQESFLSIMERFIPKKILPPKWRNLPWLNKSMVQSMRKNALFKNPNGLTPLYISLSTKVLGTELLSQLRCAKKHFFHNLNPSNNKDFRRSVKYLTKKDSSTGTIIHDASQIWRKPMLSTPFSPNVSTSQFPQFALWCPQPMVRYPLLSYVPKVRSMNYWNL